MPLGDHAIVLRLLPSTLRLDVPRPVFGLFLPPAEAAEELRLHGAEQGEVAGIFVHGLAVHSPHVRQGRAGRVASVGMFLGRKSISSWRSTWDNVNFKKRPLEDDVYLALITVFERLLFLVSLHMAKIPSQLEPMGGTWLRGAATSKCVKMNLRPCKPQNSSTKPLLQNLKGDKEISSTPPCWYQHLPRPVRCCFISAGPDPGTLFYPLPHMGGKVFIPAQPNENGKMLGLKNPQQGPSHRRLVYGAPWSLPLGCPFPDCTTDQPSPLAKDRGLCVPTRLWIPCHGWDSHRRRLLPAPLGLQRRCQIRWGWFGHGHLGRTVELMLISCVYPVPGM